MDEKRHSGRFQPAMRQRRNRLGFQMSPQFADSAEKKTLLPCNQSTPPTNQQTIP
jgi:hypothetical protein